MRGTALLLSLVLLGGCATAPSGSAPAGAAAAARAIDPARVEAETRRLNEWFEARYEEELRFSPMALTFLGRRERYDQIDDFSLEAAARELAWKRATVEQMEREFDRALLDAEARRSWDIWKYQYEQMAAREPFRLHGYLFEQMDGMQSSLPTFLISFHEVATEAEAEAWIARAGQIGRAMGQLLDRAHAAAQRGIRPPRFAYEGAIEQASRIIAGAPFDGGRDSALWEDIQRKLDALVERNVVSRARADELLTRAREALVTQLGPYYRRVITWLQADMPNALVNPTGVSATMPEGAAYYRGELARMTTTSLDAEEIHRIGLREVKRLRGEMTEVMRRSGFKGSLEEFFEFTSTDPQFLFPDTDEGRQGYLDAATAAIDNIRKVLPQYFGILPKADLVVRRVEPFREIPGGAQHYYPGTPDGSRPGVYYAHLADMKTMPTIELEVIAYHEGLPGHHMQISIAQELETLPTFRRQANSTAYAEGWGLYAEWLAREMPGTYTDLYSRFGQLSSEMWRAVRLVVDTGLHAKGWTEEQAVAYFKSNTATADGMVRAEIQRYLVMPGQATAYKIGMLRIQELRARAEKKLGSRFDIRAFHDLVLDGGAVPLEVLERRVNEWISARSAH